MKVYFNISGHQNTEIKTLIHALKKNGLEYVSQIDDEELWRYAKSEHVQEMLIITDNEKMAVHISEAGGVCIGYQKGVNYFSGAEYVTDDLTVLDQELLSEIYCHKKGIPVIIATTERLLIREISLEDLPFLEKLGEELEENSFQDGMEKALTQEHLHAYIGYQYRFFGYGIWCVLKKDGSRVGICGLQDAEQPEQLELQYALKKEYRGCGYAEEMCRAVIAYTGDRTECRELMVRIWENHAKSRRLAEKLGFLQAKCIKTHQDNCIYYMKSI